MAWYSLSFQPAGRERVLLHARSFVDTRLGPVVISDGHAHSLPGPVAWRLLQGAAVATADQTGAAYQAFGRRLGPALAQLAVVDRATSLRLTEQLLDFVTETGSKAGTEGLLISGMILATKHGRDDLVIRAREVWDRTDQNKIPISAVHDPGRGEIVIVLGELGQLSGSDLGDVVATAAAEGFGAAVSGLFGAGKLGQLGSTSTLGGTVMGLVGMVQQTGSFTTHDSLVSDFASAMCYWGIVAAYTAAGTEVGGPAGGAVGGTIGGEIAEQVCTSSEEPPSSEPADEEDPPDASFGDPPRDASFGKTPNPNDDTTQNGRAVLTPARVKELAGLLKGTHGPIELRPEGDAETTTSSGTLDGLPQGLVDPVPFGGFQQIVGRKHAHVVATVDEVNRATGVSDTSAQDPFREIAGPTADASVGVGAPGGGGSSRPTNTVSKVSGPGVAALVEPTDFGFSVRKISRLAAAIR